MRLYRSYTKGNVGWYMVSVLLFHKTKWGRSSSRTASVAIGSTSREASEDLKLPLMLLVHLQWRCWRLVNPVRRCWDTTQRDQTLDKLELSSQLFSQLENKTATRPWTKQMFFSTVNECHSVGTDRQRKSGQTGGLIREKETPFVPNISLGCGDWAFWLWHWQPLS